MDSKKIGNLGEKVAENYLKKKGYKILDRNYSNKFLSGPKRGEIDLIAKKDETISFIEVKALTENGREPFSAISPEMKVDSRKQRKIIKMAESWLIEKKIPLNSKWQIDIISIKLDLNLKKAKIRHFKNAIF